MPGKYYMFEGNGRVFALRTAFPGVNFAVEATEYHFATQDDLTKVQRRMERVRWRKGM